MYSSVDVLTDDSLSIDTEENAELSNNTEDSCFDKIIGYIEDLLLENEFHAIQQKFLDDYWEVFEPMEENKLIYTTIFNEYNKAVENYIVEYLQRVIPQFNINLFLQHLHDRRSELEGEVFEVLSTFTDFVAFKEMFLDYRAIKEGKVQDLSSGISVISLKMPNAYSEQPPR